MTMLDDRARSAAQAVHDSVADYRPAAAMPVLVRRHTFWQAAQWAAATAGAVVLIAFVALITAPSEDNDLADTTLPPATTVAPPTTIVDGDAPEIVPLPTTLPATVPDEAPVPVPPAGEPTTTTAAPDVEPPLLEITSPEPESRFTTSVVTFTGRTEPGATVVASGKFDVAVGADGTWSVDLVIFPGKNGASFVATDSAGNTSSAAISVWLDVEEPPKEEPPPPEFTFTAFATYGSCELDPPYDIYYGTAKPGSTVTISSPYGSGSAVADAEGNWEKQVFFPEAPYGETFLVTIKDYTGAKKKIEFVSLAGA